MPSDNTPGGILPEVLFHVGAIIIKSIDGGEESGVVWYGTDRYTTEHHFTPKPGTRFRVVAIEPRESFWLNMAIKIEMPSGVHPGYSHGYIYARRGRPYEGFHPEPLPLFVEAGVFHG